MKANALYRQHLIKNINPQFTDSANAARQLWETMAAQIILIVGEGGFNSLYARAVSLIQPTFPWLKFSSPSAQADNWLATLILSLEGQSPEQASAANSLLLITFTDILASLIGEDLTIHILQAAWGINPADLSCQEIRDEQ
ncbi:MAG: hypothetical protein IPN42_18085 [Methylococcaceae bacterium]|nr:hypothetical protein [Methylococcaceae bacterium]